MSESENTGKTNDKPWLWKPGQSGNPGGRPKKKLLTEVTEELLEEKLENEHDRAEYKAHLWKKLTTANVVGAMTLDRVWERVEGKMPTQVNVDGDLRVTISERMTAARERRAKK